VGLLSAGGKTANRARGHQVERLAEGWLRARGLRPLRRNYHCRQGELDLIMTEGETLVFVEVRHRSGSGFGDGIDSITRNKRRRVVRAARHFLARNPRCAQRVCRFDVVGMEGALSAPRFEWIRNAFDEQY